MFTPIAGRGVVVTGGAGGIGEGIARVSASNETRYAALSVAAGRAACVTGQTIAVDGRQVLAESLAAAGRG